MRIGNTKITKYIFACQTKARNLLISWCCNMISLLVLFRWFVMVDLCLSHNSIYFYWIFKLIDFLFILFLLLLLLLDTGRSWLLWDIIWCLLKLLIAIWLSINLVDLLWHAVWLSLCCLKPPQILSKFFMTWLRFI